MLKLLVLVYLSTLSESLIDGEMELMLVQAVWRHGDRSPTKTYPTDPFQDGNWTFGGGGFGQLSPIGMRQHLILGKLLRKTYVDSGFLSKRYSSKEIYIRSTDVNRTIISAMSNLLGMYGQDTGDSVAGEDYPDPDVQGWPRGYVPIAIHTVDDDTDYIGNPDAVCPRQDQLWEMAKSSPELQAFQNRPDVAQLLGKLSVYCGENVTIDNLWIIQDALFIEQMHVNETLRKVNLWFSDELYNQITLVNDDVELYQNGLFGKPVIMNSLDVGLELQKIRGGSLINDINMHMNIKVDCMRAPANDPKCKWINGLKYYAYSAHDTTIYAFFSIMGIAQKVIRPRGYPLYSAATFIELWWNRTDNQPYFKLYYHASENNVTIYPITDQVDTCGGKLYCKLDVFRNISATAKPDQPMDKVLVSGGSTSVCVIMDYVDFRYHNSYNKCKSKL
ncbi:unnamed protein product [Cylicocyclus nassatus]|uniref:Acid phosphatase n=1 Tax=Cylicocyclus nassatus TaxID=53992 RepID=A0AA36H8L2_CYLNA|nr:unnamed protein product [Cylicocyclus nassatus]